VAILSWSDKAFSNSSPMKKLGLIQAVLVHPHVFSAIAYLLLGLVQATHKIKDDYQKSSPLLGVTTPIIPHFICNECFSRGLLSSLLSLLRTSATTLFLPVLDFKSQ